jgi:predicted dehydrogenase
VRASDRLRIGVLSTADIGLTKVIPAMQKATRAEVVAIGSRDLARAQAAAAQLGIPRAHASYEALLADPEVDAVYIPLPNHLHAEWAIAAAAAGKHVLCEKPLALSVDDAQLMIDAADRAGVRLMEAFMYRLHPSWVAARELVGSGRIGQMSAVQSWFSYYNDDAGNIRNIVSAGGGALYDIGCYCINLSRTLFGGEPTKVQGAIVRDEVGGTDALATGILEFPTGFATFTCSTRLEDDQRVHIYGTEGRITIPIPFNIPPDRPTVIQLAAGGNPPVEPAIETFTFDPADPYTVETDAFAAAILDGTPLPFPTLESLGNLRVIEQLLATGPAASVGEATA